MRAQFRPRDLKGWQKEYGQCRLGASLDGSRSQA